MEHYNLWWASILWFMLYGCILVFLPFYRKCERKPRGLYLGFAAAFAFEMFGIPFSLFVINWIYGILLPEGFLWGHTLFPVIGYGGLYAGVLSMLTGFTLILSGWKQIYRKYWSKQKGKGRLVQEGIYRYIRHPQYTGLFLITLGMMMEWLTLPLILLWPALFLSYWNLARREEEEMKEEFGDIYLAYHKRTGMFFPRLKKGHSRTSGRE